ncbi:hypothetical protein QOT17_017438 [Balamuthia mandrillaris]
MKLFSRGTSGGGKKKLIDSEEGLRHASKSNEDEVDGFGEDPWAQVERNKKERGLSQQPQVHSRNPFEEEEDEEGEGGAGFDFLAKGRGRSSRSNSFGSGKTKTSSYLAKEQTLQPLYFSSDEDKASSDDEKRRANSPWSNTNHNFNTKERKAYEEDRGGDEEGESWTTTTMTTSTSNNTKRLKQKSPRKSPRALGIFPVRTKSKGSKLLDDHDDDDDGDDHPQEANRAATYQLGVVGNRNVVEGEEDGEGEDAWAGFGKRNSTKEKKLQKKQQKKEKKQQKEAARSRRGSEKSYGGSDVDERINDFNEGEEEKDEWDSFTASGDHRSFNKNTFEETFTPAFEEREAERRNETARGRVEGDSEDEEEAQRRMWGQKHKKAGVELQQRYTESSDSESGEENIGWKGVADRSGKIKLGDGSSTTAPPVMTKKKSKLSLFKRSNSQSSMKGKGVTSPRFYDDELSQTEEAAEHGERDIFFEEEESALPTGKPKRGFPSISRRKSSIKLKGDF